MPTDPTTAALEMAKTTWRKLQDRLNSCDERIQESDFHDIIAATILTAQTEALEAAFSRADGGEGLWAIVMSDIGTRINRLDYRPDYRKAAEELKR